MNHHRELNILFLLTAVLFGSASGTLAGEVRRLACIELYAPGCYSLGRLKSVAQAMRREIQSLTIARIYLPMVFPGREFGKTAANVPFKNSSKLKADSLRTRQLPMK
jgi:hypothetical protein